MNDQINKGIGHRLKKGWNSLFKNSLNEALKPFPKDHFFTREEIEFLNCSKGELTLLEKWALQLSNWAKDKAECAPTLPAVKWQNGQLTTWIGDNEVMESNSQQVERLKQLKTAGYQLPALYESMIAEKHGLDLVGTYFKDQSGKNECIIQVERFIKGDETQKPSIAYSQFCSPTSAPILHTLPLQAFQDLIQSHDIVNLQPSELKKWLEIRERVNTAHEDFLGLVEIIHQSYPLITAGILPDKETSSLYLKQTEKDFLPMSWSMSSSDSLIVSGYVDDRRDNLQNICITQQNAHEYVTLIRLVEQQVEKDCLNAHLEKLMNTMGNRIGDSILYIPATSDGIPTTKGHVDGILLSNTGKLSAFRNPGHKEVSLSEDDLQFIKKGLIEEGVNQIVGVKRNQMTVTRQVNQLTKELPLILGGMELFNQHLDKAQEVQVSPQKEAEVKAIKVHSNSDEEVFLMRDYVLSLQDPLCPLSGNKELLPPDSDVKQILNQQEKLEEEYDEYVTTMDLEAQNQMEEKIQEASCRYEEKLASLVNDYLFQNLDSKQEPSNIENDKIYQSPEEAFFEPIKGRWHTEENLQKQAFSQYGALMADRLSLQVTYPKLPWLKSMSSLPGTLGGAAFDSKLSILLAIYTEKEGYEVPVFLSEEELKGEHLKVDISREAFLLADESRCRRMYNIEQTNFAERYPERWEEIKSRYQTSKGDSSSQLRTLTIKGHYPTLIVFDGKKNMVSYSEKENVIHMAPSNHFDSEDDYLRDLSIGLVRSTRKEACKLHKYEHLVKEDLLAHIGCAMIGQQYHFDVRSLGYCKYWKSLLTQDPAFTKSALSQAEHSASIIFQYAEKACQAKTADRSIDLRTTTPIDMDVDGNGIVESQENMAADSKQGENERSQPEETIPLHGGKLKHIR